MCRVCMDFQRKERRWGGKKSLKKEKRKILLIALHEGHSLHELQARCGCPHVARSHVLSVSL